MTRLLVLGALVTALHAQTTPAPPAAPPRAGSIAGVVRDSSTGDPLQDLLLTLGGASPMQQGKTEAGGKFKFAGLKPGMYQLVAHGGFGEVLGARSIALDTAQDLESVELRVLRSGAISGRLVDENREPVPSLQVFLISTVYRAGAPRYEVQGFGVSDAKGEYELDGVRPGLAYLIAARANAAHTARALRQPDDPAERKPLPVETWYPNASVPENASPVILLSGEHRENIDLRIKRLPARCVEGKVESEGDKTPPQVQVSASSWAFPSAITPEPDGAVRICWPERNALHIVAYRQPGANVQALVGSELVPGGDEDVQRVHVLAAPVSSVSASIEWDGEAPAAPVPGTIAVGLSPFGRSPLPFEVDRLVKSPIPGSFTIPVAGEDQILTFGSDLPKGTYVKDVSYAGAPVESRRVRAGSGGSAELRITMARDAGSISVLVQDDSGKPLSDMKVVITPSAAVSEADMSTRMIVGISNQFGAFTAENVKPGDYLVAATARFVDLNRETIAHLWRARDHAKEVEVGPKASVRVTIGIVHE